MLPPPPQGFVVLCGRGPGHLLEDIPARAFALGIEPVLGSSFHYLPLSELPLLGAGGWCSGATFCSVLQRGRCAVMVTWWAQWHRLSHLPGTIPFNARSLVGKPPESIAASPPKKPQVLMVFIICQRLKECILPFFQRVTLKSNRCVAYTAQI